jgi:hypothetical protein
MKCQSKPSKKETCASQSCNTSENCMRQICKKYGIRYGKKSRLKERRKWLDKDTHVFDDDEALIVEENEPFDFICCKCQHSNELTISEVQPKLYHVRIIGTEITKKKDK